MNIDAFRCMRQGVQLFVLNNQDTALLRSIEQYNSNKTQRALLLLHGFSSTPAVFRHLIPSLSPYYEVILCPALAGHAEDINAFSKATASTWVAQAEQIYQSLDRQFKRIDVMGFSLGGILACHLSMRFAVHHLYLLAPALDLQPEAHYLLKLAKLLRFLGFAKIRGLAGNLYTSMHCEIAYRQIPIASIIEILNLIQQFHFLPPTCPTDLFLGCHDKVIASWRVADRFAGKENINIHWLAHSAHVLPLDGDKETILACIKQNLISNKLTLKPNAQGMVKNG